MLTIIGSELNLTHNALEIYVSGCRRNCPGCHNPEAQAFGRGKSARLWLATNRFKFSSTTFARVWILGGDLLEQPLHEAVEFVAALRHAMPSDKALWLWTGAEGLDDVPRDLLPFFDLIKTGNYQQERPPVTVSHMGHDGQPVTLTLASDNQCLHHLPEHRRVHV